MTEEVPQQMKKYDARAVNCVVGKTIASSVRSTLGPKGMDKLIVKEDGTVIITNDGATIMKEMKIDHPIGKMLVKLAEHQDSEVGDGTTSAVVLSGALFEETEKLLAAKIHISSIINGYKLACERAKYYYKDVSFNITIDSKEELLNIINTSMTGKSSEGIQELSHIVLDSINNIYKNSKLDRSYIDVKMKPGKTIQDSYLYKGLIIPKAITSINMPKEVNKAKIILLNVDVDLINSEKNYNLSNPNDLKRYMDDEEQMVKEYSDAIIKTGANVVFCQKGINEVAEYYLSKAGILAVKRVPKGKIDLLAKLTGAIVVSSFKELNKIHLGYAKKVYESSIDDEEHIFIEGFDKLNLSTIILRGGTEQVVQEIDRAVNDSIGAVLSSLEINKYVVGAGSCEMYVSNKLRSFAKEVGGKEQRAIESFANALESIPNTLIESSSQDFLDAQTTLRNKVNSGNNYYGVDVINNKISDMRKQSVLEPLKLKLSALSGATEVVNMILRIDDVIQG